MRRTVIQNYRKITDHMRKSELERRPICGRKFDFLETAGSGVPGIKVIRVQLRQSIRVYRFLPPLRPNIEKNTTCEY